MFKPLKRLEIVVNSVALRSCLELLEECGVPGYTVIKNVVGKGTVELQRGDEITGVFDNAYIITTCRSEELEALGAKLRAFLKRQGGVCLVSDAAWLSQDNA